MLPLVRSRRSGGLKVLLTNRLLARGGRSLGTTRPPAVTRMPGGLPCSLSSLSALPRLIEGEGDGFLSSDAGAIAGVADNRRLLFEAAGARVADAEGRKTCSVRDYDQQLLKEVAMCNEVDCGDIDKKKSRVECAGLVRWLDGAPICLEHCSRGNAHRVQERCGG